MTESHGEDAVNNPNEHVGEVSVLAVGSMLLRARRFIIGAALVGGVAGLGAGMLKKRVYVSAATFIPQGSEGGSSSLAQAASQFGLSMPGSGGGWGPPIYLEVLRSREVLEPIARDTIVVPELGGRNVPVMELLELVPASSGARVDRAISRLGGLIKSSEDKRIGAVKLSVTSRWPSVSEWIARQLVERVDNFNLRTRKSQAAAERKFVEEQVGEAERRLRAAEDRLQAFREQNRIIASPELMINLDRLQRDVGLAQQLYASLLSSRDQARISEVRNTPVITIIEPPRLPVLPESRGTVRKAISGGIAGAVIGMVLVILARAYGTLRRRSTREAREFVEALDSMKPRVFRRGN